MLSINTNLSSIITQNSMKQSTNKLNEAIERMTTGYKINHAKDNAANYSISTNMSTKISAYDVAADNVAMGMDMLTTASENMTQMENLGKRLHALNIQARNGTYGKQSLNAIQAEANSIIDEINRLYSTAKYNGISLFDQKEYDIPEGMPQADPVTGFIENPYDYTEEDLKNIESISKVMDSFTESEYKIETVADLAKLAKLTNDGVDTTGVTFVLANDLDLKEYCEKHKDEGGWTPIGNETNQFKGTFNGNGHIISNLTINRPSADYQGLFGYCSLSKIINLGIEEGSIWANSYVGLVVGYTEGIIIKCYAEGNAIAKSTVGGIVGKASGIDSCYSLVNIKATGSSAGGLAGSTFSKILNSYATGNVQGRTNVGGLVGMTGADVTNCYATGNVKGQGLTGGLVGRVTSLAGNNINIDDNAFYGEVDAGDNKTKCGSLIGVIINTNDGVNFGQANFRNNEVISQDLMKIGDCVDSSFQSVNYDMFTMLEGIEEIQLKNISISLQVGTKSDENSQIDFNTNFEYALGRIVRNGIHTDDALNLITDFLNTMSDKQTQLGAVQNRLESAMDEIITQHDNLVSARSTLRDADMAELSSQYIQQQILQEASATLMATANQSPAIALQLI